MLIRYLKFGEMIWQSCPSLEKLQYTRKERQTIHGCTFQPQYSKLARFDHCTTNCDCFLTFTFICLYKITISSCIIVQANFLKQYHVSTIMCIELLRDLITLRVRSITHYVSNVEVAENTVLHGELDATYTESNRQFYRHLLVFNHTIYFYNLDWILFSIKKVT